MGCDIHSFAEVRKNGKWEKVGDVFILDEDDRKFYEKERTEHPFIWRQYGLFGWLADVRNYSHMQPISIPRGIPRDLSPEVKAEVVSWDADGHSHSWLSLKELLAVDYEVEVWDRRVTREERPGYFNGAALANEGEGKHETLREFLGTSYFAVLEQLKALGQAEDVRIVFWFDN